MDGREGDRVSALLDIVSEAREIRDAATAELVRAIRKASEEGGHTGTQIAAAARLSKQRVSQLLREGRTDREDERE